MSVGVVLVVVVHRSYHVVMWGGAEEEISY